MEKDNYFSDAFMKYYRVNVLPVAQKCAKDYPLMVELEKEGDTVKEDDARIVHLQSYIDIYAIWFIGLMIGDIEYSNIKGIRLNTLNSINSVHNCLNSQSYWEKVWGNKIETEEAKNLRQLGDLMEKLIKHL